MDTKKLNFVYGFLPTYYVSRVCGMMPFSIVYDSNGEPKQSKVKKCDQLWLIFHILLFSYVTFCNFRDLKLPENTSSTPYTLMLCDYALYAFITISAFLLLGMDIRNRQKFVDFLRMFTIFDRKVSQRMFFYHYYFLIFVFPFRLINSMYILIIISDIDMLGCLTSD